MGNGLHVCFPSKRLSPMLECGFESPQKAEYSEFSCVAFLKLVVRGFLRVLRFPSPPSEMGMEKREKIPKLFKKRKGGEKAFTPI